MSAGTHPAEPSPQGLHLRADARVTSTTRILLYSVLTSFSVFAVSLLLQNLVYDDWMHETGPLRIVGTALAAVITFIFVFKWQAGLREQHLDALRRFEVIAEMNDRIRNALQIIECVTYVSNSEVVQGVRQAVDAIDDALQGVIAASTQLARRSSKDLRRSA